MWPITEPLQNADLLDQALLWCSLDNYLLGSGAAAAETLQACSGEDVNNESITMLAKYHCRGAVRTGSSSRSS